MTGKKLAWCSRAVVLLAFAVPGLGGCTTSDSLVDQAVAASTFGPEPGANTCAASADAGVQAANSPTVTNPDATGVSPSAGCNKPIPSGQLLAKYSPYTLHAPGKTLDACFSVQEYDRQYFVWLPKDYDQTKPYRVTFLFMGCGDRNAAATATYKLMTADPKSIYVSVNMPPEGLPPAGKPCYDNTVGQQSVEWEFMGLVGSKIQQDFCVDQNRLFVSGYSSGAWISNMFGCYFAGKDPSRKFGADISVRGQASVTGGPVLPDVQCGGKEAALWIHDSDDKENIIGGNSGTSLPRVLAVNGCTGGLNGPKAPWGSTSAMNSVCQQYTACPPEYPVIFCATSTKGHSSQDDLALPTFIEFENMMNAK